MKTMDLSSIYLRIRLSKHAKDRMHERKIRIEDVAGTLSHPEIHIYDRWNDVFIAVGSRGNGIVYSQRGDVIEVITVLTKRELEALIKKYGLHRYKIIS